MIFYLKYFLPFEFNIILERIDEVHRINIFEDILLMLNTEGN